MADPTWEESAPVEAGTPSWEDTTAIDVAPPPVQGVTAEQIQARRLTPQQETLRRAALGELDLGPYTGVLGPHREEKAAEAIQFLSSLQEPPISIPRPTGRTTLGKIGAGVVRGAAPLIESVVSPAGLILAGAGGPGAGKVAQYGMRGAFAGIAAKAAKEAWDRARRTKDPQDYTEAIVASAGVPLVLGTPEVAPRQVRPVVPPDVLGRFLPTPPGAPAPRVTPPVIERVSPEAAAANARAMQRRATAAYEPPRLAPPQVPEGPLEPPTVTPEPPPAPPELATWDDFVAHLSRNGTGLETRNQIRAMFADVVPGMSSEAAAKLARDAFGAEWMPGGRPPQAPARAEPPTAPVAPPAPAAPTPPTPGRLEWMGKPLEEWEKMTSSADLPKGGARVRLARSLGLAEGQDTPARILAAIKKRTGEIRAAAATKPPPPPPEAPGAAPVPVPSPPKPPAGAPGFAITSESFAPISVPPLLHGTTLETKNPLRLRVAAITPTGEKVIGKPGQLHANLDVPPNSQMGFALPDGRFLTRDQASDAQLAALKKGTVTLYAGKGGVGGAGEGGSWFTGNLEKARSYGPDVRAVEVPREVADQAKKAAQQQGQGGDTYFLTREHADKAQPIAAPPAKVTEIPTEETTAAESFAKETGWTFSPSAAVMPTPEELAALTPEKRAQFQAIHQANGWEFTDRRPDSPTKGMTFYTKIGATPEEIRAAYTAHLAKNAPKAPAPPAVRPPAGELFAVPEGPRTGPAARSYIVRRLEELEDVDPITGEAFPKEDLTEAQEKARRRFRAMLAGIEAQAKPTGTKPAAPGQETPTQTMARVARERSERAGQWREATNKLPNGTIIAGWKKTTIGGEVFWVKGDKKGTADILEEAGLAPVSSALEKAGIPIPEPRKPAAPKPLATPEEQAAEQARLAAETGGETVPKVTAANLRAELEKYEGTGEHQTLTDLVERLESMVDEDPNAPGAETLRGALESFRDAQKEDYQLAGRGDMDAAEAALIRWIKRAAKDAEEAPKPPAKPPIPPKAPAAAPVTTENLPPISAEARAARTRYSEILNEQVDVKVQRDELVRKIKKKPTKAQQAEADTITKKLTELKRERDNLERGNLLAVSPAEIQALIGGNQRLKDYAHNLLRDDPRGWVPADWDTFLLLREYREREAAGNTAPSWDAISMWKETTPKGAEVDVFYHPWMRGVGEMGAFEFRSDATSSTGYRSHIAGQQRNVPIKEYVRQLIAKLESEREVERAKALRASKKLGKQAKATKPGAPVQPPAAAPPVAPPAPEKAPKKLPAATLARVQDRNLFPGRDYEAPANSVIIQLRDLQTYPMTGPILRKPYDGTELGAIQVLERYMREYATNLFHTRDASFRESVFAATDAEGRTKFRLMYNPTLRKAVLWHPEGVPPAEPSPVAPKQIAAPPAVAAPPTPARPPVAPPPGAPVAAKTATGQEFTDIGPNPPEVVAARAEVQRLEADVEARGEAVKAQIRKELDETNEQTRRDLHAEGAKMASELTAMQQQLRDARDRLTDLRVAASFAPLRGIKEVPSKPKITAKVLKAQRDTLLSQVDSAIKAAPDTAPEENKITFSVPGDGEWTIRNDKEGLRKFRKLAEEQFPDSVSKGTPSKGPTKGKAMPKAETPEAADLPEIGARAVSEDPARFSIQTAYADGTQIVSTDGRQMIRITTDQAPGTPAEPVRLNDNGKVVPGEGDFPNYHAVLDARPTLVYGGMKTDELWHIARQGQVFAKSFDKPQQALQLLVNPDKSIGARMVQAGGELFEHNVQPGARNLGSYNADYLFNAADVARRLGNERVDVYYHSGEAGPIGFVGKNHEHVIMPMRMGEGEALRDEPGKFSDTGRNPANTRQPLGLGPLRNPEGPMASGTIETASGKFSVTLEAGEYKVEKKYPKTTSYGSDRWEETGRIGREELAGLKGKARQEAIAKAAGATETERVSSEVVSKLNAEMNKLAKEREGIIAEGQKRQKATAHVTAPPTTPPPGASFFASPANPLGAPVSPQAVNFHSVFLAPLERLPERTRILWRRFAMQSAPRITAKLRAAGEAGVRLAAAPFVSRTKGEQFAAQVLEGIKEPLFERKFGEALTEDNLRDLKRSFQDRADEAADPDTFIDDLKQQISELQEIANDGDVDARRAIAGMKRDIERISAYTSDDAQAFQDSADAVTSLIGGQNAWFRTEDEYQAFLRSPDAQLAIARHIQLWKEEKDPLYRQANDLDPDLPVQTRGLQTGARVNLKAVMPGEGTATTVGPAARTPLVRQAATLIRKDPFGRPATGAAKSYEVSYRELMANGFGREYPVAKQHEFIRILLDSGKGVLRDRGFESDLMIGGERAQKAGYLMTLRPWAKKWLYVPESIAPEVQSILGLEPSTRLGFASDIGDVLTKLSITGFAEGTTHISNLSIEMLTGLGPTANPMLNALIKSMGRADILWRLPKTLIEGFSNRKAEMLALAEIGAAKRPYGGTIGWFINKIDQGGRLVSADIYKRMAAHGWVPDTETGLREFVNAGAGQYIKAIQPGVIRKLRETTIQPFATALHTFNVRGIREMGLGPGAKGTSKFAALALRMDKAGGFIGFVVLLAAINRLVSGSSTGPKGTQLGNVGWIGDDGKIHQFPLARLFGYERGPRAIGALAAIEARRAGLSPGTTALKTVGAVGNTAVSYVAGPLVRFGTVAISGKRPGVPMVQEAPVMPPQDELRPLKMQAAQNILTAAQTASPAVDAVMSWKQGKPAAEIMQRQFGRYTPRAGMAPETYEALPKIIESSEMYKYADYVASRARRLPIDQRADFIVKQFEKDGVQDENWRQAWQIIRRKGVLRYD